MMSRQRAWRRVQPASRPQDRRERTSVASQTQPGDHAGNDQGGDIMTTAAEMVTAAKTTIDNLDVDHTAAEIADGALLVDLREHPERIDDGTIPGSVHVPRGLLEFAADPTHQLHVADLQPD